MNYRHAYHAGNFADVFKHGLLVALIQELLVKDKAFCYLDTHAGIGHYDLQAPAPQKTQEFTEGILQLWSLPFSHLEKVPGADWLLRYLQIIHEYNQALGSEQLRFYPGSSGIVRHLLRRQDRMILTELHPQDVLLLKQTFVRDPQVAVHHLDGYQALKAFLPPKEKRGVVLIDPPFENRDEWAQLLEHVPRAVRRWPTGIYAIWYPIKEPAIVNRFYQQLQKTGLHKILCCEWRLSASAITPNFSACGMIIINPPWLLKPQLQQSLPWLCQQQRGGQYNIGWLVPE